MTVTLFRALDDEALLRRAHAERDPLVTTDLEIELQRRLEAARDELAELERLREIVDRSDIEAEDLAKQLAVLVEFDLASGDDLRTLLSLLNDHDCLDADYLRKRLDQADRFGQIEEAAGDLVGRLQTLITTPSPSTETTES